MASYKYGNSTNYFKESDNKFRNTSFTVQPGSSVSFTTANKPGDADFFLYRFIITSGLSQYSPEQYRYNAFIKAVATEVYKDINNDTFKRTVLLNCAVDIEDSVSCTSNIQIPSAGATLESVSLVITNSTNIPVIFSGLFLFPSYSSANAYSSSAISELEDNETDEDDDNGTFEDVFKTTALQTTNALLFGCTIQKRGQQDWYGKTSRFALTDIQYYNGTHGANGTVFDMWGNKLFTLGAAGGQLRKFTEYLYVVDDNVNSIADVDTNHPGQLIYFNTMGPNGLYYKGTGDKKHYDLMNGTSVLPSRSDQWDTQSTGFGEYVHYLRTQEAWILENFLNFKAESGWYVASNLINKFGIGLSISHMNQDGTEVQDSGERVGITFFPRAGANLGYDDVRETLPVLVTTEMAGTILMFVNIWNSNSFVHDVIDVFEGYMMGYDAYISWASDSYRGQINTLLPKIREVVNSLMTSEKITSSNFQNSLSENIIDDNSHYSES